MRDALVFAVGVAISPVAIVASILLLTCPKALANGSCFVLGWTAGVASATVSLVLLVNAVGLTDADPAWIGFMELALGSAFLAMAAAVWRRRQRRPAAGSSWLDAVDTFGTARSAGLGIVLSGANPKVIALSLGAALSLARVDASGVLTAETVVAFSLIGALGAAAPIALYAVAPERSATSLAGLRRWLTRHETSAVVILGLVVGMLFVLDGVTGLQ